MSQPLSARTLLPADEAASEEHQYLTFSLHGESFAVGILAVKEIIGYSPLTEVPLMPEAVRGVINLRGSVVPVVDLSARFWNCRAEPGKRTCIVILELKGSGKLRAMGVMVDAVNKVAEIPRADIEPPPALGSAIDTGFIVGMGKLDGRFIVILDTDRVLSIDQPEPLAGSPALVAQSATV